jgi:hypothetical protein
MSDRFFIFTCAVNERLNLTGREIFLPCFPLTSLHRPGFPVILRQ